VFCLFKDDKRRGAGEKRGVYGIGGGRSRSLFLTRKQSTTTQHPPTWWARTASKLKAVWLRKRKSRWSRPAIIFFWSEAWRRKKNIRTNMYRGYPPEKRGFVYVQTFPTPYFGQHFEMNKLNMPGTNILIRSPLFIRNPLALRQPPSIPSTIGQVTSIKYKCRCRGFYPFVFCHPPQDNSWTPYCPSHQHHQPVNRTLVVWLHISTPGWREKPKTKRRREPTSSSEAGEGICTNNTSPPESLKH